MRGLQKNKGITLIALIITVIILLILAAVSISMVSGDGLFQKARTSADTYKQAQIQEILELAKAEYLMENINDNSLEGFASFLQEHSEEYGIADIDIDNGEVILTTNDGYIFSLNNDNGEININGYGQASDVQTIEVEATAYIGTYDGNAHGISVVSATEGVKITYSTDGLTYTSELPTYIQTGGYTTFYKVKKEGYKTVSGSLTVTISRAQGGITLSESSGTFNGVESKTITVSNNTGEVTAVSSNTDVATVSVNGNEVTISSKEITTTENVNITITSGQSANYESASATYIATVTRIPVFVNRVTVETTTGIDAVIGTSRTIELKATVTPSNADDTSVTWTSSNTNIATVNANTGVVTGVDIGTVTIVATAKDGSGVTGSLIVEVWNGTIIRTIQQFKAISNNLTGQYRLGADLDFEEEGTINGSVVTGTFNGTFDGNGHTIKNYTLNVGKSGGLFKQSKTGVFKNIRLYNGNVTGTYYVGNLVRRSRW